MLKFTEFFRVDRVWMGLGVGLTSRPDPVQTRPGDDKKRENPPQMPMYTRTQLC